MDGERIFRDAVREPPPTDNDDDGDEPWHPSRSWRVIRVFAAIGIGLAVLSCFAALDNVAAWFMGWQRVAWAHELMVLFFACATAYAWASEVES